jgi:hypothetical protein
MNPTQPPTAPLSAFKLAGIVVLTLALSLFFFSPSLWIMRQPMPGSYQWDRGLTYLRQCEQPLRRDIETAMHWRLLPPLAAHTIGLRGKTPLVIPWLGALAMIAYVAVLLRRRSDDVRVVLGGTIIFASTSAINVPLGLLGLNDAWVWLGLFAVAFARSGWAVPLACLLCPWVDERFIIGFPLAWCVARVERNDAIISLNLLQGLWLIPYAVIRLSLTRVLPSSGGAQSGFIAYTLHSFPGVAPLVPFGWWFGLRAAWLGVFYAGLCCPRSHRLIATLTLGGTLGVTAVLAHDLSRSVAIVLPVAMLGAFDFLRRRPEHGPRVFALVGVLALLLPAAHVIYHTIQPISPLPVEVFRLLRSTSLP